jgi:hypothetical protein
VRDFAREFGVAEPSLSEAFWRNEHHLVGVYGPLGPDLRLRARFVGAQMRWDERPDRLYDLTVGGAAQAVREIADFLRVGPGRLMNARQNMRDAAHYVREMQQYDVIAAATRPRLNGVNGFQLLDTYRRAFRNAIAALQSAANQLLETPRRADYLDRFGSHRCSTRSTGFATRTSTTSWRVCRSERGSTLARATGRRRSSHSARRT